MFNNNNITIAIPTYERRELLAETLSSALKQDFEGDWKIVICDNSHTDLRNEDYPLIKKLLENSKVKYIHNKKNLGMFGNWNKCLSVCETEFISILCDDDLLDPNFLSVTDNLISKANDGVAYLGNTNAIGDDSFLNAAHFSFELKIRNLVKKFINYCSKNNINSSRVINDADLFYGNPTNSGPLAITIDVAKAREIGGYRAEAGGGADWDLLVRLSQKGTLYLSKNIVGKYRYEDNATFHDGVMESFIDSGSIIRLGLISLDASILRKSLFKLANFLQNKLQNRRYKLILKSRDMVNNKMSVSNFLNLVIIFIMRIFLRATVKVFSYVK
jgi:glycosyltransferase